VADSQISLVSRGFTGCGKNVLFCHSERSEESLFDLSLRKEREIPRSARNDKMMVGLFPLPVQPRHQNTGKYGALAPGGHPSLSSQSFMKFLLQTLTSISNCDL
jgi:hypothetical protein